MPDQAEALSSASACLVQPNLTGALRQAFLHSLTSKATDLAVLAPWCIELHLRPARKAQISFICP